MINFVLVAHLLSPSFFQEGVRPLPIVRPFLMKGHKFVVVAHRGDHTEAPENSLDAYERAIKDGCDFGEADLRLSQDGVIVLMHDGTVNRTTDGIGPISALTFEQIRNLKLKGALRPEEKVPTFEELLKLCKGKMKIYMDIKSVRPKDVLPLLRKYRMEKDVIAYLYGEAQRQEWIREAPEIPIISDIRSMKEVDKIEESWSKAKFSITDGNAMKYTVPIVQKWHELGVAVIPDIQNPLESPTQWQPLIDAGVDGFQTDHPKAMIDYLREKKIR